MTRYQLLQFIVETGPFTKLSNLRRSGRRHGPPASKLPQQTPPTRAPHPSNATTTVARNYGVYQRTSNFLRRKFQLQRGPRISKRPQRPRATVTDGRNLRTSTHVMYQMRRGATSVQRNDNSRSQQRRLPTNVELPTPKIPATTRAPHKQTPAASTRNGH